MSDLDRAEQILLRLEIERLYREITRPLSLTEAIAFRRKMMRY